MMGLVLIIQSAQSWPAPVLGGLANVINVAGPGGLQICSQTHPPPLSRQKYLLILEVVRMQRGAFNIAKLKCNR